MHRPELLYKRREGKFVPAVKAMTVPGDPAQVGLWVPYETLYALVDFVETNGGEGFRADAIRVAKMCREAFGRGDDNGR